MKEIHLILFLKLKGMPDIKITLHFCKPELSIELGYTLL